MRGPERPDWTATDSQLCAWLFSGKILGIALQRSSYHEADTLVYLHHTHTHTYACEHTETLVSPSC